MRVSAKFQSGIFSAQRNVTVNGERTIQCYNVNCRKVFYPHAMVSSQVDPAAWVRDSFYCSPECEREGRAWAEAKLGRAIIR